MAVLNTPEELLSALAANPFPADPLADLKKKGHTLSPVLQQQSGDRNPQAGASARRDNSRPVQGHAELPGGASSRSAR